MTACISQGGIFSWEYFGGLINCYIRLRKFYHYQTYEKKLIDHYDDRDQYCR